MKVKQASILAIADEVIEQNGGSSLLGSGAIGQTDCSAREQGDREFSLSIEILSMSQVRSRGPAPMSGRPCSSPPRADGCAGRSVAAQGCQACQGSDGAAVPGQKLCISAASIGLNVGSAAGLNGHDPPARPSLMASLAVGNFQESLFQVWGLKPRAT
jgi:hypothetical protein